MNIIGLTGVAGAGKDTVADHLVFAHGFTKIGLADPLKRYALDAWGFTAEQLWGPSERRAERSAAFPDGPTAREALQLLGTEWGRALHPDVWVRYALRVAGRLLHPDPDPAPPGIVIPDVRFDNEAAAIVAAGGTVWAIVRPSRVGPIVGVPDHVSERGIDPALVSRRIHNDTTIEVLREAASRCVLENQHVA